MKKYILLGLVLVLGCSLQVKSQTVDEIINKYLEAYGGLEKLEQIHSVVKTGIIETENQEGTIKMYNNNLTGYKVAIEMDGIINYELANTREGLEYFPSFGREEVLPMQEVKFRQALMDLNVLPAFIHYAEKGNSVEFKGIMESDDGISYKLALTTEAGDKADYFINIKTGYLIKTVYHSSLPSEIPAREIRYADFRVVGDKFIFPFKIENNFGTIQLASIEVNVPIKEAIFSPKIN